MIINKIHIYGFGKFEDYKLDLSQQVNVVYGENEAGKSTIFAFIHAILFGFPVRNQSAPGYEPSGYTKYGGKLSATFPDVGDITIERIKKPQGSECRIYYPDGTVRGEDALTEIIGGLDRHFYESIYSFNLDGLQEINRLNEEQLGRFLFYAGISGSEHLWETENQLQKEMDLLFKPGGKKPLINQKLAILKESSKAIQKARDTETRYNDLRKEESYLDNEIQTKSSQLEQQNKELIHLKDWNRLLPSIKELAAVRSRLDELRPDGFPANGIKRMESLESVRIPNESLLKSHIEKRRNLQEEIRGISLDNELLQMENQVRTCETMIVKIEAIEKELETQNIECTHIEDNLAKLQHELHVHLDEQTLESLDTSILRKQEIRRLELEKHSLEKKKEELDHRLEQERVKLEQLEKSVESIREKWLPDKEKSELRQKIENYKRNNYANNERQIVTDTLERLKNKKQNGKNTRAVKKNNERNLYFLVILMVLIAAIWSGVQKQFGVSIALFLVGFLTIFLWKKIARSPKESEQLDEEIRFYEDRLNQLAEANQETGNMEQLEAKWAEDESYREQYRMELYRKQQQEAVFDSLIDSFEEWEKDMRACEQQLVLLGREWSLPDELSLSMLSGAYERLENWKSLMLEKKRILSNLDYNQQKLQEYKQYMDRITNKCRIQPSLDQRQNCLLAIQAVEAEILKKRQLDLLTEKLHELNDEIEPLSKLCTELETEREQLMKDASCENVNEFYKKGKDAEERNHLSGRDSLLTAQLGKYANVNKYSKITEMQLSDQISQAELDSNQLEQTLADLRDRQAEVKYEITRLEEDGTVEELLHKHQIIKEEFQSLVKTWLKLSTAKGALAATVSEYKAEKLPAILELAKGYIQRLTDGRYVEIIFKDEQTGLILRNREGQGVQAKDLSRGTAELAYVSIRLALAGTIDKQNNWPMIMDDTFVNFDDSRTERILGLLKDIGKSGNQIVFFTCHKHLLTYFVNDEIVFVA